MFRDFTAVPLADCAAESMGREFPRSNHMASVLTNESMLGWFSDSDRMIKALNAR